MLYRQEFDTFIRNYDGVTPYRILWGSDMPASYVWSNLEKPEIAEIPKDNFIRFYGE